MLNFLARDGIEELCLSHSCGKEFFYEADSATRDQIIALLESGTSTYYSREDLLSALAWIGDEVVQACFQNWRDHPPAWHAELINPLDHYTTYGGWELTRQGKRRDLYYPANYDLVLAEVIPAETPLRSVEVIAPHEGACGWCDRQLLTLFEIDLENLRMAFPGLVEINFRIAMCMNCSLQGEHIFTDIDRNGTSYWSSLNGDRPAHLRFFDEEDISVNSLPHRQLVLGAARRTPYISHGSHLGGCPQWVQNPEYPHCPGCQQAMTFVGQYEPYHVNYIEGIFYAFLCTKCGLATTGYQQT